MSRTKDEWLLEIKEDLMILMAHIERASTDADGNGDGPTYAAQYFAGAVKEAKRVQSDIYRFAKEVYGIEAHEIDEKRT